MRSALVLLLSLASAQPAADVQPLVDAASRLAALGQYDLAAAELTKAIDQAPRRADLRVLRGRVYGLAGKHAPALADFDAAVKADPESFAVYLFRGAAHKNLGHAAEALADFDAAVRLAPTAQEPHVARGELLNDQQQWAKAEADFDAAIRLGSRRPAAYGGRALARERQQNYAAAVLDYTEALERAGDPGEAVLYRVRRGAASAMMGVYASAKADFLAVQQMAPDHPAPRLALARLWATCPDERYRDGAKAVEYATAVCETTEYKESAALDTLAAAYAEVGQFDDAVRWGHRAATAARPTEAAKVREHLALYEAHKPLRACR